MDTNEVWTHKDNRNNYMKILGRNQDRSIKVTFDLGLNPKRTYDYQRPYIEKFYKFAGYKSIWKVDPRLTDLSPRLQKVTVEDVLPEINDEDILFSNHTGDEKVDKFQSVEVKEGESALTK